MKQTCELYSCVIESWRNWYQHTGRLIKHISSVHWTLKSETRLLGKVLHTTRPFTAPVCRTEVTICEEHLVKGPGPRQPRFSIKWHTTSPPRPVVHTNGVRELVKCPGSGQSKHERKPTQGLSRPVVCCMVREVGRPASRHGNNTRQSTTRCFKVRGAVHNL